MFTYSLFLRVEFGCEQALPVHFSANENLQFRQTALRFVRERSYEEQSILSAAD
jgi:hypothetical protein